MTATYDIGTQYLTTGKVKRLCTIVDILRTYNNAGALVQLRYMASHQFCGQCLYDVNVSEATIARGIHELNSTK